MNRSDEFEGLTRSRLDDEPAMSDPAPRFHRYVQPSAVQIAEATRLHLDFLIDRYWDPNTGHVSKSDLRSALLDMAGYAYGRAHREGWDSAINECLKIIEKLKSKGA